MFAPGPQPQGFPSAAWIKPLQTGLYRYTDQRKRGSNVLSTGWSERFQVPKLAGLDGVGEASRRGSDGVQQDEELIVEGLEVIRDGLRLGLKIMPSWSGESRSFQPLLRDLERELELRAPRFEQQTPAERLRRSLGWPQQTDG